MLSKSVWFKALFLCVVFALVAAGSVLAQEAVTKKIGAWRESCPRCQKDKAPEAKPTVNKCNEFIFDSTSSYDPNNKKISVDWDFGDGTSSTDPVVKHVYDRSGEYTVTLKVTNNTGVTCDTDVSTQKVLVNTPPVADFMSPDGVCVGQEASFDASATTGNMSNGTYTWDFGDGTKETGAMVRHAYDRDGTYQVRLSVNDNANTSCSTDTIVKTVTVGSAPVAVAGRDREMCLSGSESMRVTFDGSGSYGRGPLTYDWNFGDGTSDTGAKVVHEYAKPGIYDVTLTVRNEGVSGCNMSSDDMKVSIFKGPSVSAGDDASVCVNESVSFNGSGNSGSGSNLSYRWDFGDGTGAEGATATHAYAKGGTYRAILRVDDGTGSRCATAMDVKEVVVGEPPVASLADVSAACTGERVMFDASGSTGRAGALKYTWDFGDGVVEEGGSRVSHVYEKGGQYNVVVNVKNCARCNDMPEDAPCSMDSASTTVKVNSAPVADAGPNTVCCAGKESMFDGSGSTDPDNDTLSYYWNFGDGSTAEGARVQHVYENRGTYKVVLTVDDNTGSKCSTSSDSFIAHVFEQPTSVIKVR